MKQFLLDAFQRNTYQIAAPTGQEPQVNFVNLNPSGRFLIICQLLLQLAQ